MKPTGSNSFKGRRSHSGRSVKLNEGLDKRLASYAAAASAAGVGSRARAPAADVITHAATAAGVGLLLTAGPASARIVYTPAYINVNSVVSGFNLDLNHDGITDFRIFATASTLAGDFVQVAVSSRQAGNAILGKIQGVLSARYGAPFTCRVASALAAGHRIGPGSRFGAYQRMVFSDFPSPASGFPLGGLVCGYWGKAQGRFLGFEFTVQGRKNFGWARLNTLFTSVDGIPRGAATLTGYAYETEPNKPIRAGDTGPVGDARVPEMHRAAPAVATVRPATLGVLALGSAGLDIWRKEQ
jgi:hypothetical protein